MSEQNNSFSANNPQTKCQDSEFGAPFGHAGSGLLVSVRSTVEARAALSGGADLIDVKEPRNGSLGRADDETIAGVLDLVAGRRPVSAALGELRDGFVSCRIPGLRFVKCGLAGLGSLDWVQHLNEAVAGVRTVDAHCQLVPVAYADWRQSQAPPPLEVADFACRNRCPALLIDTYHKDGRGLLDWLTHADLELLTATGIPLALAGSLSAEVIESLAPLQPRWFAVRGAACRNNDRNACIEEGQVRRLVALVRRFGSVC